MKFIRSKSSKLANSQQSLASDPQTQEFLRQTRISFNLAIIFTSLSAVLILGGTGLSCSGKTPEGGIMIEGGKALCLVSEQFFIQSKAANERLEEDAKDQE
jgi:hypothetical protein